MMADPWDNPVEQVLGAALQAGDVVRQHGYRWDVQRVVYDAMKGFELPGEAGKLGRYVVYAKAIDAPGLPRIYREDMSMGLREDMHWHREVSA